MAKGKTIEVSQDQALTFLAAWQSDENPTKADVLTALVGEDGMEDLGIIDTKEDSLAILTALAGKFRRTGIPMAKKSKKGGAGRSISDATNSIMEAFAIVTDQELDAVKADASETRKERAAEKEDD